VSAALVAVGVQLYEVPGEEEQENAANKNQHSFLGECWFLLDTLSVFFVAEGERK
jgi:hypothetical protein